MIKRLVVSLVSCLFLSGCMSSLRVNRSDSLATQPKGIPFYVKTCVCKQETAWLEPQYILVFESKSGDFPFGPVQKVLTRSDFQKKEVQDFIARPDLNTWRNVIATMKDMDSYNEGNDSLFPNRLSKAEAEGDWIRVSNTGAIEVVVDYGNVFYLNSARPIAGSTQVDAKLAGDGTLTEGSAQLQDQTLSTITGMITSLVSSASKATKAAIIQESKLTVTTKVYKHTHSQYDPSTGPKPGSCKALPEGVVGGSFTVTEASSAGNSKPDSSGKDNTISITGSIVLPKATTVAPPSTPAPSASTPPKKSP